MMHNIHYTFIHYMHATTAELVVILIITEYHTKLEIDYIPLFQN